MARRRREPESPPPAPPRIRYVGTVMVPASQLVPHDQNWRIHPDEQRAAIRAAFREVGFTTPLQGRRVAGDDGAVSIQLIDGHLRREELLAYGDLEVPVNLVDLSDEETKKELLVHDPIGSMAEADSGKFGDLMTEVQTENQEYADLLTALAEAYQVIPPVEPEKPVRPHSETTIECPNCGQVFPK